MSNFTEHGLFKRQFPTAIQTSKGYFDFVRPREEQQRYARSSTCVCRGRRKYIVTVGRAMIIESPADLIFRDLFYRLRSFADGHDVFLKLEGFNITGSIKIKTAIGLVEDLERRGLARPNETVIVESSSGNLGIALSLICSIKGYKFICVTDPVANRSTVTGMELYRAEVIVVKDRDAAGGFLGSRLKVIDDILSSRPNAVWVNQYANPANTNVHAEQTANEIAAEFERVDWVFVGTGTTGTIGGISEKLRSEYPGIKVVAVEPVGSVTSGERQESARSPGSEPV